MRSTLHIAVCAAALAGAACNPSAAPEPDTTETETDATQPWDYAKPKAEDDNVAPAATTPRTIPAAFHAVWAIDPVDCTSSPGLTRITIAPDGVTFYEGRSVVTAIANPHAGALTLEVNHTSEGTTSTETHALALEEDGKRLAYNRGGEIFNYVRCAS